MIKIFFLFSLLSIFAAPAYSAEAQEKPTGEEIAAMTMNASKYAGGLVGKGTMDVVDLTANKIDDRNFTIFISVVNDELSSIFRFTDPKPNLAKFLSIDKKGKGPELYMYFKTYKQPLQIKAKQNCHVIFH